jgi:hypothetical protein
VGTDRDEAHAGSERTFYEGVAGEGRLASIVCLRGACSLLVGDEQFRPIEREFDPVVGERPED